MHRHRIVAVLLVGVVLVACGPQAPADTDPVAEPPEAPVEAGVLRVYTTVTQDTVDAVVAAFEAAHDGVEVEVFRAPTGEFNARVAAERREGEIRADVFWLTDPLSMLQFDADGLLARWTPDGAAVVDEAYRSDTFWGTRVLNLVIVASAGLDPAPTSWWDLADPAHADAVAIPDPAFAGSAFGALAYLALDDAHGFAFYEALAANGAVQVNAPGEVVSGVAEGRFVAGMTLDRIARDAVEDGSPVQLVWPEPGAIAVHSPIAVLEGAAASDLAERFVEHVLTGPAQAAIAATGWQPVHPDVDWPHPTAPTVAPDWNEAFARQDELLDGYRAWFGG